MWGVSQVVQPTTTTTAASALLRLMSMRTARVCCTLSRALQLSESESEFQFHLTALLRAALVGLARARHDQFERS